MRLIPLGRLRADVPPQRSSIRPRLLIPGRLVLEVAGGHTATAKMEPLPTAALANSSVAAQESPAPETPSATSQSLHIEYLVPGETKGDPPQKPHIT